MKINNKGYLLLELIVVISIMGLVMSAGASFLLQMFKDWKSNENIWETRYNCRITMNKLMNEIRESCGVKIINFSDKGWIKIYKFTNKDRFITFKAKKNKLFIGYNNTLNSNSEFANYVKKFKVKYLPEGVSKASRATGVKIFLKFKRHNTEYSLNSCVAFRYK